MKAIIMAGGMGTRLQPLTRRMPKPMVPLLDRPVMEYIVELLHKHGIIDVAVTLGYLPEAIRNHFSDGSRYGVRLRYSVEEFPLGTAGGVKRMEDFLDETFVVMSGDGLTDLDINKVFETHRKHGASVTIVLAKVKCPKGYGVVLHGENGLITSFIEKPEQWVEGGEYHINTGIYIMEPAVLRYVPKDTPYDFGRELFPSLLRYGIQMYGYVCDAYWSDIGTLRQYYQTQIDMIEGHVNVSLPIEVRPALSI